MKYTEKGGGLSLFTDVLIPYLGSLTGKASKEIDTLLRVKVDNLYPVLAQPS
jgi:hypothetical protein